MRKPFRANKCCLNLLYIKAFSPCDRGADTLHEQHQFIPPQRIETGLLGLPEHFAADAPDLHALVVYHIAATLPVQKLHQRAAAVEEHVHGTVTRFPAIIAGDAAQRLDTLAEVYATTVDHKIVGFIQTKHSKTYFCGCKGTNKHANAKYVLTQL